MNPKRRAELQRKLSLNAVPRPPAGLAERIKAEIPRYLEIEAERARFSRSIAFNMRIAASILLLVTSLVVTVYLVSPEAERIMAPSTAVFAPADRALPRTAIAPTQEVRLEIAQEPEIPEIAAATPPPPPTQVRAREERTDEVDGETGAERTFKDEAVVGGVVGGVAGGTLERRQVAEFAPAEDFAPEPQRMPASAPPPPAAAARDAVQQRITVTANAPTLSIMREARAAKVSLDAKDKIFGISVDPAAFQRIRATLESGQRPAASAVDVEALVNYFAAAAARPPRSGIALEVEASPAAIEADGDHAVLRFTVDTAKVDEIPGGSTPPIAADARIEVEFNDHVVARASRIGNGAPLADESVLFSGISVTGIYALEMKPNLRSKQTVATVRLHYTAVPSGRKQTITEKILAGDLAKSWARATRRHRLASLGAVWGETLKGTTGGVDVARRAEELATQKPDDPLARALAAAASASADEGR